LRCSTRAVLCLLLVAMVSHVAIADWSNAPVSRRARITERVYVGGTAFPGCAGTGWKARATWTDASVVLARPLG